VKLQQLRYAWEVYRRGTTSRRSRGPAHFATGISKQIKLLEQNWFRDLARRRNRIVGLPSRTRKSSSAAQRILTDVNNLRNLGEDFSSPAAAAHHRDHPHPGALRAAEDHRALRQALPDRPHRPATRQPHAGLRNSVEAGHADIAIGTETTHLSNPGHAPASSSTARHRPSAATVAEVKKPDAAGNREVPDHYLRPRLQAATGGSRKLPESEHRAKRDLRAVDADVSKTYASMD